MTSSQNVLFAGESALDDDYEHPPGMGIARLIEQSLRDEGFDLKPIENWRDCGWSIDLSIGDAEFQIALAPTVEENRWMLQIACTNEPGLIGRLLGKPSVDYSEDVHKIACTVHAMLQTNEYTEFRWRLDGFPDELSSTSVPMHP